MDFRFRSSPSPVIPLPSEMKFHATKKLVENRGHAPDKFLTELVLWAKAEEDEVFAPNDNTADIYAYISPQLGPWSGPLHRKAALCEAMRVHAGFESTWNWNEGVDTTNHHSQTHKEGQETGIFQVSPNSLELAHGAMKPFAQAHGISHIDDFLTKMKSDHTLALSYYARLVRHNVQWAGPIKRREINSQLSRASVSEFEFLLT